LCHSYANPLADVAVAELPGALDGGVVERDIQSARAGAGDRFAASALALTAVRNRALDAYGDEAAQMSRQLAGLALGSEQGRISSGVRLRASHRCSDCEALV
jgi:hypothetical protein